MAIWPNDITLNLMLESADIAYPQESTGSFTQIDNSTAIRFSAMAGGASFQS